MSNVFDNYECEGQTDIFDFISPEQQKKIEQPEKGNYKRKPLIYHMGLSAYYYECPYCKAQNSEKFSLYGTYCGSCLKIFDGIIEKKTKDYIECEKQLGSGGGAVYKDDKGKWHWSDLTINAKTQIT